MLDFLFISSPTNMTSAHMPYHFLYLSGYLRKKGYSCKIIDYKNGDRYHGEDYFWKNIERNIRQHPSRFVGLACHTPDYPVIRRLGEVVKKAQPETKLLVGNAHATIRPYDFFYDGSPFDVVVRGEGEIWCERLASGYLTIPTHFAPITGTFQSLRPEKIAMPAYDLIDLEWYRKPQKEIIRRLYTNSAYIFSSRGCPFKCTFCSTNVNRSGNKIRHRDSSELIYEIQDLKRHGFDFFYIADDTFGIDKNWMVNWFSRKELFLRDTPYVVQTRASNVTEEMVHDLKATGCIQLEIGVETPVQQLLKHTKKQITLSQIKQVYHWCKEHKLRLFNCYMINLPTETESDIASLYKYYKNYTPTSCVLSITTPYPGTVLHKEYIEGSPFDVSSNYWKFKDSRTDEAFRMANHNLDLGKTARRLERKMKIAPFFERMWALRPFQKLYWKTIWKSGNMKLYINCWASDTWKTSLKWIIKRLNLDKLFKELFVWKYKNE